MDATTGPGGADQLRFCVLGPLQVIRSGQQLPLGGRQQKTILALLLVDAGQPVSVDRLADTLWGNDVPHGAVATIQAYVSRLRGVLEPGRRPGGAADVLLTERGGYRLRTDDHSVDAHEFEELVRKGRVLLENGRAADAASELAGALGLWRGPVLADLADNEFVVHAATRLNELRAVTLEDRVDAELALGHHREVVGELDRLIGEYPLRERLHGQRMLARYRSGCQSEALAGYDDLRAILGDELGIDPSPPLQRLQRAVLLQAPDLDWQRPSREVGDRPTPGTVHGRSRRPSRRAFVAAVALAVVAVAAVTVILIRDRPSTPALSALPANSVGRLDAQGVLRSSVDVGQGPTGVAYGAGSVWVTNSGDGTLSRIDPDSNDVIQTIQVGNAPSGVTVTGDDIWVANGGDGTVSRVNALAETETDVVRVGNQPTAIAGGTGGIWVANGGDDTVQRIDPVTGGTDTPVRVGGYPDGLVLDGTTLWVANGLDGTVVPVGTTSGRAGSPITVGSGPKGLAVSGDSVWVANALDQTVTRIDSDAGRVLESVATGDGPGGVAATPGAVWVSNEFDGTVSRIDAVTGGPADLVTTGGAPAGIVMVGSSPWIASGPVAGAGHRGGTLHIENAHWIPFELDVDFLHVYDEQTLALLYDGLVAQRRTGGVAGMTLVPDLATRLPRPTDGGRVYTFTIRDGVHYSNGVEVQPSDIRRGLVRALRGPPAAYFTGIVGSEACAANADECDLSRGVLTDDATSTVVLRLTAPDPEFLYKLSAFVYATAPGVTPGRVRAPMPTTGPYMVASYRENSDQLTLVRNPYFHQWSYAARPDGYPDVIRWTRQADADKRLADVLSGRADLMDFLGGGLPGAAVRRLGREHPTLLHTDFGASQGYLALDVTQPPFDDQRLRRALNYAVDRRQLVSMFGGSALFAPSCQFLPPNFPGYRPYCPYTRGPPADGSYRGPDLPRARRLVAAARARGAAVTIAGDPVHPGHLIGYFRDLLGDLGLRVRVTDAARPDASLAYWGADFPTPSNFWAPVMSCADGGLSLNFSGFCNPGIDRLAEQAMALEGTDPAAARRVWAKVDRRITDAAPWVFAVAPDKAAVVSPRVGNYQSNPVVGPLVDQIWVR